MELIESLSNFKEGMISYQTFENPIIELLKKCTFKREIYSS